MPCYTAIILLSHRNVKGFLRAVRGGGPSMDSAATHLDDGDFAEDAKNGIEMIEEDARNGVKSGRIFKDN